MKIFHLTIRLFIVAISFALLPGCQSAMDSFVETRLKQDAEATNKRSGTEVGDGVRLDSASATGKTIRFCYTMLDVNKEDINASVFYKTAKTELIKTADTTTGMDFYKKNNVTIAYVYYYQNGTPLSTIIIKPEDYTHKK